MDKELNDNQQDPNGDKYVDTVQDLADLNVCIRQLNGRESLVVYLCVFEGWENDEAARVLEIPDIRLRAIKCVALKKLRKCLEGGMNHESAK